MADKVRFVKVKEYGMAEPDKITEKKNTFNTYDLENKDEFFDWIKSNYNDITIKAFKMNHNTYNYLKAGIIESVTLTTDNIKEPGMLEAKLMSVPIIFDEELEDYIVKAE